jgi:hypothetical protein
LLILCHIISLTSVSSNAPMVSSEFIPSNSLNNLTE